MDASVGQGQEQNSGWSLGLNKPDIKSNQIVYFRQHGPYKE